MCNGKDTGNFVPKKKLRMVIRFLLAQNIARNKIYGH